MSYSPTSLYPALVTVYFPTPLPIVSGLGDRLLVLLPHLIVPGFDNRLHVLLPYLIVSGLGDRLLGLLNDLGGGLARLGRQVERGLLQLRLKTKLRVDVNYITRNVH